MNCPKCDCPNPQGATHCQLCYEVFNRSAADRYIHALRKVRRQEDQERQRPDSPPLRWPSWLIAIHDFFSDIDWNGLTNASAGSIQTFFQTRYKQLAIAAGVIVLGSLVLFFASSRQRGNMFGTPLNYVFRAQTPVTYQVGFHSEMKSWSERAGRLDTPLANMSFDEMGNVSAKTYPLPGSNKKVVFQPKEWIVTQTGAMIQKVSLSHPSLKPAAVVLNAKGVIVKRINADSTRLGRSLSFLAPQWPSGAKRPGTSWDEPVEWIEPIGDWKFHWKGKRHWTVAGVETWDTASCVHLTYTASLTPHVSETPVWAQGSVGVPTFDGTATGDACFDRETHQIYSNDFVQQGTLRMTLANIYRIPSDLRVGRTPRRRWGEPVAAERGTLFLEIKNRIDIHKS